MELVKDRARNRNFISLANSATIRIREYVIAYFNCEIFLIIAIFYVRYKKKKFFVYFCGIRANQKLKITTKALRKSKLNHYTNALFFLIRFVANSVFICYFFNTRFV